MTLSNDHFGDLFLSTFIYTCDSLRSNEEVELKLALTFKREGGDPIEIIEIRNDPDDEGSNCLIFLLSFV